VRVVRPRERRRHRHRELAHAALIELGPKHGGGRRERGAGRQAERDLLAQLDRSAFDVVALDERLGELAHRGIRIAVGGQPVQQRQRVQDATVIVVGLRVGDEILQRRERLELDEGAEIPELAEGLDGVLAKAVRVDLVGEYDGGADARHPGDLVPELDGGLALALLAAHGEVDVVPAETEPDRRVVPPVSLDLIDQPRDARIVDAGLELAAHEAAARPRPGVIGQDRRIDDAGATVEPLDAAGRLVADASGESCCGDDESDGCGEQPPAQHAVSLGTTAPRQATRSRCDRSCTARARGCRRRSRRSAPGRRRRGARGG
jgi:hypothetical protein